jgi:hypothetical protein
LTPPPSFSTPPPAPPPSSFNDASHCKTMLPPHMDRLTLHPLSYRDKNNNTTMTQRRNDATATSTCLLFFKWPTPRVIEPPPTPQLHTVPLRWEGWQTRARTAHRWHFSLNVCPFFLSFFK